MFVFGFNYVGQLTKFIPNIKIKKITKFAFLNM